MALFASLLPAGAATTPKAVAQASATATITGQATVAGGAGLAGATVTLDGPTRASATTDNAGKFSFTVPAGQYTITVNKGGYQTGSTQVSATDGAQLTVNVELTESNLQNLQVIGRTSTSTGANAAKFNISSSTVSTLTQDTIQQRDVPEIAKLISTLPGVVTTTNSGTVVNNFRIRGFTNETQVEFEGHPISGGVTGTFLASFTDSGLVGGVDVLRGAGLNGPIAAEAGGGIINLRTPDFSSKDTGYANAGIDSYGGTFYTAIAKLNFGKLSLVLGKSFSGYENYGAPNTAVGLVAGSVGSGATATNAGPKVPLTGTYYPPYLTNNLGAYDYDFTAGQQFNAELAKARWKFSDATSFSAEFFGLQGGYFPEGSSYGQFDGFATLPQCLTAGKAAGGAACNLTSTYNAPAIQNLVGVPNTPLYTYFPATYIRNNNPNFAFEFKTTLGNDTIFLRPYAATINRNLDQSNLNSVYGNGATQVAQGSYEVISNANCQVQFIAPTATGGAKGPCYTSASPNIGYVNSTSGVTTTFPVTTTPTTTCSVATPCFTTMTMQDNAGQWGFGNTSTQQEIDKLAGYTFTYIHPVGNNIFNLSFDHYYNDTVSYQNDASPLAPGCAFTQLGGTAPSTKDPGYQPGCTLIGPNGTNTITYKPTPLAIPETFASISELSLTGQFQLRPDLEFDWGNYYTRYTINGQQESPAFIAAFTAAQVAAGDPVNTSIAPIVLSGFTNSMGHYDPHFGLVYRPRPNLVLRATYGSSIDIPYASLVSGLETVTQTTSSITFTQPNPNLLPEVMVDQELGGDYRFKNGQVLSLALYNDIVHNPWVTVNALLPGPPAGFSSGTTYFQSSTFNEAGRVGKGVEFGLANLPATGFGYSLSGDLQRLYYYNLDNAYLATGTKDFNHAADFGEPYSKAYLNLQWAGDGSNLLNLLRFGIDYEGPGNAANYLSYFIYDAGIRLGLPNGIQFQTAIENVTNLQFGSPGGHAIANQGLNPVQVQYLNGQYVLQQGPIRGIVVPLPLTARFSLVKKL